MIPARRAMVAFALLFVVAGAVPSSTAAAEPYRPLPGYRPAFVTETDSRPPWRDCLWATGAMLLDKWTTGEMRASHAGLHALAGDRRSSDLQDVSTVFATFGLSLRYSPNGGDFITWPELLGRLEKGAGAILLGDYGHLPRYYGRFDPQFWRNDATTDDHALYLDRYDRAHDRIWVMDPLGPRGWEGQWMPRSALVRYAWRTPGGGLWTATTPTGKPAPFAGVKLGDPAASATSDGLVINWPIDSQPHGWALPSTIATTTITRRTTGIVEPGTAVLATLPDVTPAGAPVDLGALARDTAVRPPTTVGVVAGAVVATLALPTEPGAYDVTAKLVEQRFGHTVAVAGPYVLYVPGDRAATIQADVDPRSAIAGRSLDIPVSVVNDGSSSWADPLPIAGIPGAAFVPRSTRIWAHWQPDDPDIAVPPPPPVPVAAVALAPGEIAHMDLVVAAPPAAGHWTLVLDVADTIGSFAAAGSVPASIPVTVSSSARLAAPN